MNENQQKHKIIEIDPQRLQILELLETENKIAICVIRKEIKDKPENMSMK